MLASAADRAGVKLYYIQDESLKATQQVLETKKYLAQLHYQGLAWVLQAVRKL
jgi:hypothetical protein